MARKYKRYIVRTTGDSLDETRVAILSDGGAAWPLVVYRTKPLPAKGVGSDYARVFLAAHKVCEHLEHSLAMRALELADDRSLLRKYVRKLLIEEVKALETEDKSVKSVYKLLLK